MLQLSCLCGMTQLTVDKHPEYINQCNCTLCRKSGARWGYFHPSEVNVVGETKGYARRDKDEPIVEIRFCPNCGSTTHWVLTASGVAKFGDVRMGVNFWLAAEADLAGIEVRYPDGQGWRGAGEYSYVQAPRIIGSERIC